MIAPRASRPPDELFHFHPRATNPELWRTTVPLVVRERCGRHKGLVATWTAIHWLIVLHAASGRAHFGMREIAEEAGVGRNELAGEAGYIQRLVALGLLRIVGYKTFANLREPRPIYHVDLVELARLSLELVPEVLCARNIDRPPPAAPDPRQLRLAMFPGDETSTDARENEGRHETGTEKDAMPSLRLGRAQDWPETGTALATAQPTGEQHRVQLPVTHQNGAAPEHGLPQSVHSWPATGTEGSQHSAILFDPEPVMHEIGTELLETVPVTPETGTGTPEIVHFVRQLHEAYGSPAVERLSKKRARKPPHVYSVPVSLPFRGVLQKPP